MTANAPHSDHDRETAKERWQRRLNSRASLPWVFLGSLAETTVVPIPFELLLVPLMLARPDRIWTLAAVALAGCMAGAYVGYLAGALFFDTLGRTLIELAGGTGSGLDAVRHELNTRAFWTVFGIGISPVPFQIGTVGSGFTGYALAGFTLAVLLSRALRYFGLALLIRLFGRRAYRFLRENRLLAGIGLAIAGAVAFAAALA